MIKNINWAVHKTNKVFCLRQQRDIKVDVKLEYLGKKYCAKGLIAYIKSHKKKFVLNQRTECESSVQ